MEKSLLTKLAVSKSEIGKISKDSTNPFFKSKYFDINKLLEHVEPILLENGLLVLQPIIEGHVATTIVEIETGAEIVSAMKLSDQKDPQKLGSEITYYRRYTLQSLLALQAEDDDGNHASKATPAAKLATKEPVNKEVLNPTHPQWDAVRAAIEAGQRTIQQLQTKFVISPENITKLLP